MEFLDWRRVRTLTKVPVFNFAPIVLVGVPIMAAVIIDLRKYVPEAVLPKTLLIAFLASLFFVFGHVFYAWFAPDSVKNFQSPVDYVKSEQEIWERSNPDKKLQIVLTNLESSQKQMQDRLVGLSKDTSQKSTLEKEVEGLYPSCVQRYLLKTYERNAGSHKMAIVLALLAYAIGTCWAGWLMYERIRMVFEAI
jgi:hypothetical protein